MGVCARKRAPLFRRPCERRDPYAVKLRFKDVASGTANNRSRWLWVPAFAGTTRKFTSPSPPATSSSAV